MLIANKAPKQGSHVTSTIDDISLKLNEATVFSIIDLYKGFRQLELCKEIRNMTVFAAHL